MGENIKRKTSCDKDNAFNIIVNLYIIREIYLYLNNENKKEYPIADLYSIMDIDNGRYSRICQGYGFQFTETTAENIAEKFGIDKSYFKRNGNIFKIKDLDIVDWKCFFRINMSLKEEDKIKIPELDEKISFQFEEMYGDKILTNELTEKYRNSILDEFSRETEERVKNKLEKIIEMYSKYGAPDTDDILYSIYHYLKFKEKYKFNSKLTQFTKRLENLEISDWAIIKQDAKLLKKYSTLLYKHYQYVQAQLITVTYENENE